MASSKQKICHLYTFVMMIVYLRKTTATNIDCHGKPFHCVNSTHFMICVDLGAGVSQTVDDYMIRCPLTTVCLSSNHFECEYRISTTTESTIRPSDVTNKSEINKLLPTNPPSSETSPSIISNNFNTVTAYTKTDFMTDDTEQPRGILDITGISTVTISDTDLQYFPNTGSYAVEEIISEVTQMNLSDNIDPLKLPKLSNDNLFHQELTPSPLPTKLEQESSLPLLNKQRVENIGQVNNSYDISINNVEGYFNDSSSFNINSTNATFVDSVTELITKDTPNTESLNFTHLDIDNLTIIDSNISKYSTNDLLNITKSTNFEDRAETLIASTTEDMKTLDREKVNEINIFLKSEMYTKSPSKSRTNLPNLTISGATEINQIISPISPLTDFSNSNNLGKKPFEEITTAKVLEKSPKDLLLNENIVVEITNKTDSVLDVTTNNSEALKKDSTYHANPTHALTYDTSTERINEDFVNKDFQRFSSNTGSTNSNYKLLNLETTTNSFRKVYKINSTSEAIKTSITKEIKQSTVSGTNTEALSASNTDLRHIIMATTNEVDVSTYSPEIVSSNINYLHDLIRESNTGKSLQEIPSIEIFNKSSKNLSKAVIPEKSKVDFISKTNIVGVTINNSESINKNGVLYDTYTEAASKDSTSSVTVHTINDFPVKLLSEDRNKASSTINTTGILQGGSMNTKFMDAIFNDTTIKTLTKNSNQTTNKTQSFTDSNTLNTIPTVQFLDGFNTENSMDSLNNGNIVIESTTKTVLTPSDVQTKWPREILDTMEIATNRILPANTTNLQFKTTHTYTLQNLSNKNYSPNSKDFRGLSYQNNENSFQTLTNPQVNTESTQEASEFSLKFRNSKLHITTKEPINKDSHQLDLQRISTFPKIPTLFDSLTLVTSGASYNTANSRIDNINDRTTKPLIQDFSSFDIAPKQRPKIITTTAELPLKNLEQQQTKNKKNIKSVDDNESLYLPYEMNGSTNYALTSEPTVNLTLVPAIPTTDNSTQETDNYTTYKNFNEKNMLSDVQNTAVEIEIKPTSIITNKTAVNDFGGSTTLRGILQLSLNETSADTIVDPLFNNNLDATNIIDTMTTLNHISSTTVTPSIDSTVKMQKDTNRSEKDGLDIFTPEDLPVNTFKALPEFITSSSDIISVSTDKTAQNISEPLFTGNNVSDANIVIPVNNRIFDTVPKIKTKPSKEYVLRSPPTSTDTVTSLKPEEFSTRITVPTDHTLKMQTDTIQPRKYGLNVFSTQDRSSVNKFKNLPESITLSSDIISVSTDKAAQTQEAAELSLKLTSSILHTSSKEPFYKDSHQVDLQRIGTIPTIPTLFDSLTLVTSGTSYNTANSRIDNIDDRTTKPLIQDFSSFDIAPKQRPKIITTTAELPLKNLEHQQTKNKKNIKSVDDSESLYLPYEMNGSTNYALTSEPTVNLTLAPAIPTTDNATQETDNYTTYKIFNEKNMLSDVQNTAVEIEIKPTSIITNKTAVNDFGGSTTLRGILQLSLNETSADTIVDPLFNNNLDATNIIDTMTTLNHISSTTVTPSIDSTVKMQKDTNRSEKDGLDIFTPEDLPVNTFKALPEFITSSSDIISVSTDKTAQNISEPLFTGNNVSDANIVIPVNNRIFDTVPKIKTKPSKEYVLRSPPTSTDTVTSLKPEEFSTRITVPTDHTLKMQTDTIQPRKYGLNVFSTQDRSSVNKFKNLPESITLSSDIISVSTDKAAQTQEAAELSLKLTSSILHTSSKEPIYKDSHQVDLQRIGTIPTIPTLFDSLTLVTSGTSYNTANSRIDNIDDRTTKPLIQDFSSLDLASKQRPEVITATAELPSKNLEHQQTKNEKYIKSVDDKESPSLPYEMNGNTTYALTSEPIVNLTLGPAIPTTDNATQETDNYTKYENLNEKNTLSDIQNTAIGIEIKPTSIITNKTAANDFGGSITLRGILQMSLNKTSADTIVPFNNALFETISKIKIEPTKEYIFTSPLSFVDAVPAMRDESTTTVTDSGSTANMQDTNNFGRNNLNIKSTQDFRPAPTFEAFQESLKPISDINSVSTDKIAQKISEPLFTNNNVSDTDIVVSVDNRISDIVPKIKTEPNKEYILRSPPTLTNTVTSLKPEEFSSWITVPTDHTLKMQTDTIQPRKYGLNFFSTQDRSSVNKFKTSDSISVSTDETAEKINKRMFIDNNYKIKIKSTKEYVLTPPPSSIDTVTPLKPEESTTTITLLTDSTLQMLKDTTQSGKDGLNIFATIDLPVNTLKDLPEPITLSSDIISVSTDKTLQIINERLLTNNNVNDMNNIVSNHLMDAIPNIKTEPTKGYVFTSPPSSVDTVVPLKHEEPTTTVTSDLTLKIQNTVQSRKDSFNIFSTKDFGPVNQLEALPVLETTSPDVSIFTTDKTHSKDDLHILSTEDVSRTNKFKPYQVLEPSVSDIFIAVTDKTAEKNNKTQFTNNQISNSVPSTVRNNLNSATFSWNKSYTKHLNTDSHTDRLTQINLPTVEYDFEKINDVPVNTEMDSTVTPKKAIINENVPASSSTVSIQGTLSSRHDTPTDFPNKITQQTTTIAKNIDLIVSDKSYDIDTSTQYYLGYYTTVIPIIQSDNTENIVLPQTNKSQLKTAGNNIDLGNDTITTIKQTNTTVSDKHDKNNHLNFGKIIDRQETAPHDINDVKFSTEKVGQLLIYNDSETTPLRNLNGYEYANNRTNVIEKPSLHISPNIDETIKFTEENKSILRENKLEEVLHPINLHKVNRSFSQTEQVFNSTELDSYKKGANIIKDNITMPFKKEELVGNLNIHVAEETTHSMSIARKVNLQSNIPMFLASITDSSSNANFNNPKDFKRSHRLNSSTFIDDDGLNIKIDKEFIGKNNDSVILSTNDQKPETPRLNNSTRNSAYKMSANLSNKSAVRNQDEFKTKERVVKTLPTSKENNDYNNLLYEKGKHINNSTTKLIMHVATFVSGNSGNQFKRAFIAPMTNSTKNYRTDQPLRKPEFLSEITSNNRQTSKNVNTNRRQSPVNKVQFTCVNRLRGRHADKNDCKKFYICIGQIQPLHGECPANTVFSQIKKQCTKNLSHCINNNQFVCIQEGRFIDISKDNIYYICVKNENSYIRFHFQCQGGYHLNKTSIKCMLNNQYQPITTSSTSIDSDSNKESSSKNTVERISKEKKKSKVNAEKNICRNEGKFPDPNDCRRYYVCSKKSKSVFRRRTKKCDSDEVFHREKKKCVSDESYECN